MSAADREDQSASGAHPADDEALRWAGDDPDRDDAIAPRTIPTVVEVPAPPAERGGIPAALLVVYGIVAGLYLIWTIGWVITVTRSTVTLPTLLTEIMFQFGEFLAIASPALWFGAVLLLTRDRGAVVRLVWLLLGLIVLVPWPVLLGV